MSRLASRAARRRLAVAAMNGLRAPEAAYVRGLRGVVRAIHKVYMAEVGPHLADMSERKDADSPKNARAMNPLSSSLEVLGVKVHAAIGRTVGSLFDRLAKAVNASNARTQGLMGIKPSNTGIPGLLARARDENIKLVENAHRVYAAQVREIVGNPDNFGLRVEDLRDKLLERGNVSESRAELIARDQTLKLNGQIAATRQQAAGVDQYVWSTSLDERVREEHAALEGETFDWTNPPEPGHPGQDFQCRCVAVPVIAELDEIFG